MQRRTFFGWILSSAATYVFPRWAWAQAAAPVTVPGVGLRELADVVLPAALGPERLDEAVKQFQAWVSGYRTGAEMSAGYGMTRLQLVAADPSGNYGRQLQTLEDAARATGVPFSSLDRATRTAIVSAEITAAGVDGLPRRPNGGHVATDLMSHFFFINDRGHDWLHGAAIERTRCRGLASSGERPATLS